MRKNMSGAIALLLLLSSQIALARAARAQDVDPNKKNKGKTMTIHGYVRDVACLVRHPDALKPTNDCALMCAKKGSPIFIVSKDGALYLPISNTIPDTSQQERLMPFVGKYVEVIGKVFERSGLKAIDINDIQAADDQK